MAANLPDFAHLPYAKPTLRDLATCELAAVPVYSGQAEAN
jgi:hypothetical protein